MRTACIQDPWDRQAPAWHPGSKEKSQAGAWRSQGSTTSASSEDGRTLLDEGGDALLGVGRGEELRLQLALEGEARLEGQLEARLHRALDVPDGHGGLLRRAVAARELEHLREETGLVLGVEHAVHEPEALGRLVVEELAARHQLDRLRLADDARQALRAPRAGQDAERDLRQPALAGRMPGEAHVRRER